MLEFSGWIHPGGQPSAVEDEFWARPGNVLEEPGLRLLFGDGGDVDPARVCVRAAGGRRVAAVCTGIITNAPRLRSALRADGHDVSDTGQADLIAAAFLTWGDDFAQHLDGTFAAAVVGPDDRVHLIRDRIGVKPLYYAEHEGGLVFSTRAGRVLDHPRVEPWMTPEGLVLAMSPRLVMLGETPLANLFEVKPAHSLVVANGRTAQRRYWQLESHPHEDSYERTVARVRELLDESVSALLDLDPDAGVLMSGGLDSTAVAAIMGTMRGRGAAPVRTFSLEFASDAANFRPSALRPEPDGPYARRVAAELGTDHHSFVLTTEQLLAETERARAARGMPGWGQFDTSFLVVADLIRPHCPTVLTGSFADEIFGGYPWFHDPEVLATDAFPWQGNAPRVWSALSSEFVAAADPARMERERYESLLAEVPRLATDAPEEARIREALYLSLQGPTLVNQERGERMSAAAGLAAPSPYNDHHLLEYVWNVPWSVKTRPPGWKHLLKEAVRDVVPRLVIDRAKSGYPGTHDPVYAERVMAEVAEIATDPSAPLHAFMDRDKLGGLSSAADSTMTFTSAAHMLIPLVETNTWMRRYGIKVR